MKKSKDITKYEISWQLMRASIKGKNDMASLEKNLKNLYESYFLVRKSQEAWERVANYIEALIRGFKNDSTRIDICIKYLDKLGDRNCLEFKESSFDLTNQLGAIRGLSFDERYVVWKDLVKYEKHFCSRRYRHKELESLVDQLHIVFCEKNEQDRIKACFSYDNVLMYRKNYLSGTNNKKFFF